MSKLILINATPEEARVALVENQSLAEMHIERTRDRGIVGNIYKGKVVRVLPGMQAAFVDIGLAKAGFLHVSDFYPGVDELPMIDADAVERDADSEPASASALSTTEPLAAAADAAPPEVTQLPGAKGCGTSDRVRPLSWAGPHVAGGTARRAGAATSRAPRRWPVRLDRSNMAGQGHGAVAATPVARSVTQEACSFESP